MGACDAVPDALADEISLSGPIDRIKERMTDWKKSQITTIMISRTDDANADVARIRQFAEMAL